jgi:hypothetical protein
MIRDKTHLAYGLSAAVLALTPAAAQAAEMLLYNGQIRTPAGWAEAMLVRDGVIVAVGNNKSTSADRGDKTEVIDLAGATVLPGLHDMHVHAHFAGLEQFACSFAYGAKPEAIAAKVKECVSRKAPGEWVIGGNWVGAVFAPGQQTRQFLDAVSPNNPVLLNDESHHSIWVNSQALALAGVTRDTPDLAGGVIERDANGDPTGLLREDSATTLVEAKMPTPSPADKRAALLLSTNQMLSFGITSFTEASIRPDNMPTFASLAANGTLKQRVRGCIVWAPGDVEGETLIKTRATFTRGRFKPDCVKIFMDGVPTESHTAAMLEPYKGTPNPHAPAKGLLLITPELLNPAVARFDRMGLQIKFHAVGDAAVRTAIDAVAYARNVNGLGGAAHEIGHNTFIDPADLPRGNALGLTWEMSPYIWYPVPITDVDIRNAVGETMMERIWPIKDAVDTGANVVAGSDWSIVPSANPWLAIETMVTRQVPGGGGKTIAPSQRITLEQAMRIFTENGAVLMGDRDLVGSLEVGMRADFVVTETNPFKVPITQVHATKVKMTFVDGEKVFDAASPPKLTAN